MGKVKSFEINHLKLDKGLYISKINEVNGAKIVTYDMRMRKPYVDSPMTPEGAHTLEHYLATYLREIKVNNEIIYIGPMGCMTGFYLVSDREYTTKELGEILIEAFEKTIASCKTEDIVPGAEKISCGNFEFMSKTDCLQYCEDYIKVLKDPECYNRKYEFIG